MGYTRSMNDLNDGRFDLGERIKNARTVRNVSQVELAMLLDVYQKDISRWENNFCTPSIFVIKRICEVLGVSADELLDINFDNASD